MQTCLLYIEIIYKVSVVCKDLVFWVKKTVQPKSCFFKKLSFSLLIFSDKNDKAKLVDDMQVNCFIKLWRLLCNWIWMNMIFKSSCSQMFYKTSALKNFAKFTWTPLNDCFQLPNFFSELIETRFSSIFEHVLLRPFNVMNIMNFAIEKLCFAKLERVSFLMKLHAKGLQLYWKESYKFSIIFRNLLIECL